MFGADGEGQIVLCDMKGLKNVTKEGDEFAAYLADDQRSILHRGFELATGRAAPTPDVEFLVFDGDKLSSMTDRNAALLLEPYAAFMGKVANDAIGSAYVADMKAIGADFYGSPLKGGLSTARSMIAVTPDGERSMNTFLGASTEFAASDVDARAVAAGGSIWRAICSTSRRRRQRSSMPRKSRSRRGGRSRSPCQTCSALTGIATVLST